MEKTKENKGLVYMLTCKDNGKIYIGCTAYLLTDRINNHFNLATKNYHGTKKINEFKRDLATFGKEGFIVEIVQANLTIDEMYKIETELILKLKRQGKSLYNKRLFDKPHFHSEETKEKIRKSRLGKKHTKETIKKISEYNQKY